jgi:hypothetical protein
LYTSCVLWVAPLCAFSINFTCQKKKYIFPFSFNLSSTFGCESLG